MAGLSGSSQPPSCKPRASSPVTCALASLVSKLSGLHCYLSFRLSAVCQGGPLPGWEAGTASAPEVCAFSPGKLVRKVHWWLHNVVAAVLWVDGACGFKPEACSGSLTASLSHLAGELSLQGRACWLVHVVC